MSVFCLYTCSPSNGCAKRGIVVIAASKLFYSQKESPKEIKLLILLLLLL